MGTGLRNPVFILVWGHSSMNWKVLEHGGVLLPYVFLFFIRFSSSSPVNTGVRAILDSPAALSNLLYPPLLFHLFYAFFFPLKPYRMGVFSFFRLWAGQCFSYIFLCIYRAVLLFFFLSFLCLIFSFKPL